MSRRILLAASAVALVLGIAVGASAYFTAAGRATARASVTSLSAPATVDAVAGTGRVALDWSAVTAPGSGAVSYYVRRDGGAASGACGNAASPISGTGCTDTGVAPGRHTYTVTAVWRSWSATSSGASATVTSGVATQLVFTTPPSGATGGSAFATQPVVTARDAEGNTVSDYSGTVTLAIQSGGTGGGTLSGCTGTLSNGVTSFSGCAIDRSGTGYVLRASAGALSVDATAFNVTVGAATQLAFTTQPGNGTGGSAFSTQPVVTPRDAGGNVVTGYTGTVLLSIASGTGAPDGALSGCRSSRVNGVTTFSSCEIDRAATGYRLHASDGSLSADSNAFNVTVGSIADVDFSTSPAGATGGTAFTTQPVVRGVDAGGNTVTSYTSTVSLSIESGGAGGATLSNCSSVRAVSGIATFSGCRINLAGTGYVLRAQDTSFRNDNSAAFNVTVGPAAQLAFTRSPSSSNAGSVFSTQPVVVAADAGGNTVSGYAGAVTLSITPGTGGSGATLSGCSGVLASGTTTFSGCRLDRSGSYRLRASDGTFSGDSSSFTISAGSVSSLSFTTSPSGAAGGSAFTTQPVVTALDALGNVATTYTSSISLSILSGTGTGGATLSSCNSVRASSGVATFSGCRINLAGTGYVLRASDGTRTANSTAFDVTAGRAASLLMSAGSTSVTAGTSTDLTIRAIDAGGNVATSYTGSKNLTFGGSNRSPSGASPTVTNSSGTAIALGSTTAITFTNGVATVTGGANGAMTLRDDGSDSITVTDGSIDEGSDALDMTVRTGTAARLAWTSVNESNGTSLSSPCYFACTNSGLSSGTSITARVSVTDSEGNVVSGVGSGHTVTVTRDAGSSGGTVASGGTQTLPTSGTATTGSSVRLTAQSSGTWTTNTFTAASAGYTSATMALTR